MNTPEPAKIEQKPPKPYDAEWCGIGRAIPRIIGEITPIAKKNENKQQGYKFRGVDDVYAVLNLLLEKYGVMIVPEVLEAHRESHQTKSGTTMFKCILRVRYHLSASDGTRVECVVEGEGMDSGDKSTQKALSMAYKYMAFQVFCIPTGEKIDTENDSPQVIGPIKSNGNGSKPYGPPAGPSPEEQEADRLEKVCAAGFDNEIAKLQWKAAYRDIINGLPKDRKQSVVAAFEKAAVRQ